MLFTFWFSNIGGRGAAASGGVAESGEEDETGAGAGPVGKFDLLVRVAIVVSSHCRRRRERHQRFVPSGATTVWSPPLLEEEKEEDDEEEDADDEHRLGRTRAHRSLERFVDVVADAAAIALPTVVAGCVQR